MDEEDAPVLSASPTRWLSAFWIRLLSNQFTQARQEMKRDGNLLSRSRVQNKRRQNGHAAVKAKIRKLYEGADAKRKEREASTTGQVLGK